MGWQLTTNLAQSTLASGYTAGNSSITVQTGDGAKFPTSGNFMLAFNATDPNAAPDFFLRCTARSTDTLTVDTTGAEGSTATNESSGCYVTQVITAGVLADLVAPGGGANATALPASGWTQVNWGTSSASVAAGVLTAVFQNLGANKFIGYVQASPGATYTVILGIKQFGKHAGIGLYNSGSTISCGFFSGGDGKLYCFNYNSSFAYASRGFSDYTLSPGASPEALWMKIVEDASHRTFYVSLDGATWFQVAQIAAGNYLTPTHIGVSCDASGISTNGAMIFSFSLTSP